MFKVLAVTALAAMVEGKADSQQRLVDEINNSPNVLWKAAWGERWETKSVTYGVLESSKDAVQKLPRHESNILDEAIPLEFDSETHWPHCAKVIGDIRDQSMCGCCWAFGAASAASDRLCIATNGTVVVPLSAQNVCFCAVVPNGCNGGDISSPWEYIREVGAVTGGQFNGTYPVGKGKFCSDYSMPHCHHHGPQRTDPYPPEGSAGCPPQHAPACPIKCDSDAAAPHNDFRKDNFHFDGTVQKASGEKDIQKAILEGGPVETAFTVYKDFENYAGGIYHHVAGGFAGGHAVKFVGWGEEGGVKYWKVANSWNPYWGEKGYFRIKRGDNQCGIEDGVTFSSADSKWTHGGHGL